jgi:hypothetical protein
MVLHRRETRGKPGGLWSLARLPATPRDKFTGIFERKDVDGRAGTLMSFECASPYRLEIRDAAAHPHAKFTGNLKRKETVMNGN